jgi:anti-anti-sigma regulatory factor
MEITRDKTGDVVILAVSGNLDALTSKKFEDKLLADIDSGYLCRK